MPTYGSFEETPVNEPPKGMYVPIEFPTLALLDTRTRDGRLIEGATFGTLELPRTVKLMTRDAGGHDGSEVCGRIDEITVEDGKASGRGWLLADAMGKRAAYLVATQALRGNSIDMAVAGKDVKVEYTYDEENDTFDVEYDFANAMVKATTLCMTPAFDDAGAIIPEGWNVEGFSEEEAATIVASATAAETETEHAYAFNVITERPRVDASKLQDPELTGLTPLYLDEGERVIGHIAGFGTRHLDDDSVETPHSRTDYAYFANKHVLTTDGMVNVGNLVMNGDHAAEALGWTESINHYANTCAAWADVAVGEDRYGIWISGIVRPGTTDEMVHAARASDVSGDWRWIGSGLELVAALSVPVGGFPKPRLRGFADGDSHRITCLQGLGRVRHPVAGPSMVLPPEVKYLADRMAAMEAREIAQAMVD